MNQQQQFDFSLLFRLQQWLGFLIYTRPRTMCVYTGLCWSIQQKTTTFAANAHSTRMRTKSNKGKTRYKLRYNIRVSILCYQLRIYCVNRNMCTSAQHTEHFDWFDLLVLFYCLSILRTQSGYCYALDGWALFASVYYNVHISVLTIIQWIHSTAGKKKQGQHTNHVDVPWSLRNAKKEGRRTNGRLIVYHKSNDKKKKKRKHFFPRPN